MVVEHLEQVEQLESKTSIFHGSNQVAQDAQPTSFEQLE